MRRIGSVAAVVVAIALAGGSPTVAQSASPPSDPTTLTTLCVTFLTQPDAVVTADTLPQLIADHEVEIYMVNGPASCAPRIPGPSPEPTPEPTAEPDVATTTNSDAYMEFESHTLEAVGSLMDVMDEETAAADSQDFDTMVTAARHLRDWGKDELAWLKDHPAKACYRDEFKAWKSVPTHFYKAGRLIVQSSQNLDLTVLKRGIKEMDRGSAALAHLNDSDLVASDYEACAAADSV